MRDASQSRPPSDCSDQRTSGRAHAGLRSSKQVSNGLRPLLHATAELNLHTGSDRFSTLPRSSTFIQVSQSTWTVGALDDRTLAYLAARDLAPQSGAITVQQAAIGHMLRDLKQARGTAIPADLVRRLPETIAAPKAVLWDKRDPALLYVFDVPGEDNRIGKLVVRINASAKVPKPQGGRATIVTNAVRSAGLVDPTNLPPDRYDVISGSLN